MNRKLLELTQRYIMDGLDPIEARQKAQHRVEFEAEIQQGKAFNKYKLRSTGKHTKHMILERA